MVKKLAFKTFRFAYVRFLGLGMIVFVPLAVFVDTLAGNTDDLEGLTADAWEGVQEGWSLITTGKNLEG